MLFGKERVQVICNELKKLSISHKMTITDWQIKDGLYFRPQEADDADTPWRKFDSMMDHWEGLDKHYWFRAKITIPKEYESSQVLLVLKTQIDDTDDGRNPQFLAFINNEPIQGLDINHREILITKDAKSDTSYKIDLQAYTGILHADLMLVAVLEKLDESILKMYYDIQVPLWSMDKLEADDKTRIDFETALNNTINLLDLRQPYSQNFYDSIKKAEAYIQKAVYEDLSGKNEVVATCIGHTHIDVAWWWTVAQTREKVARSFSTVLKLMDEYPDYKFMSSQPQLYKFLKQRYPDLYERLKQRVKEGRWEPEGAMWLEADCNLTSGESLVRQIMHGKKFFKDEFGVDSQILWLPDVFGYSAAMPQIMKKSGVKYFMTTKIAWNEINKMPYDTFFWKGIDGSSIFTHFITTKGIGQAKDSFFTTYNGMLHPNALQGAWERYQQKDINNDVLVCFGWGDGGGGPTREMLETEKRLKKGINSCPRVRIETSKKYFDELYERCASNPKTPKWQGELYFEYHRGTYTSMARNKRSNRKMEFALQDLEFISVWAEKYGLEYPAKKIYDIWENVLLNQFHDILPGSSIKEVYEVTRKEYKAMSEATKALLDERLELIANKHAGAKNSVVFFNTLSFDRDDIAVFDCPCDIKALTDERGNKFPVQKTNDSKYVTFINHIPAKGLKVFKAVNETTEAVNSIIIGKSSVDTPFYSIAFDKKGMITSIYDKAAGRQALKEGGLGNVLRVYEDKPACYDNWNIDIYYSEKSFIADDIQRMEWIEKGPVRATLLIERRYCDSIIKQKIYFYADSRRIDFDTYVDWKEHQQLMKVEFDVDYNADNATYDIQFGNLMRPTHTNTSWDRAKFEVCAHKWADISEGDYGLSILNDCKYGYAIHDGKATLTLIKSGIEPNPTTDQEEHWFTYSMLPHAEDWKQGGTVQEAYKLNVPVYAKFTDSGSSKDTSESLMQVSVRNVIAETVKKSEDGSYTIVRLYEFENRRSTVEAVWNSGIKMVYECDLMENRIKKVETDGKSFKFEIKPFEIKTFAIL